MNKLKRVIKEDGCYLEGEIFDCSNERYDTISMLGELLNYQRLIQRSAALGTFADMDSTYKTEEAFKEVVLANVSHTVKSIDFSEGKVYVSMLILKTPNGQIIEELLDQKVELESNLAVIGTVKNDKIYCNKFIQIQIISHRE